MILRGTLESGRAYQQAQAQAGVSSRRVQGSSQATDLDQTRYRCRNNIVQLLTALMVVLVVLLVVIV